ncbi:hypothetical protein K4749_33530 [Streptomyces sp. TRM72054]|nr:hypothetical protein [Streptomyces sp. TRM72054]MBX9398377.1 hypothetical protein [Streptomyces sp. TRM72054]
MCDAPPDSMLRAVLDSGEPSPERAVRMAPGDATSRSHVKGLSAFHLEDSQDLRVAESGGESGRVGAPDSGTATAIAYGALAEA